MLPEMITALVLVVATITVGVSAGLAPDRDDCCPVQSSLGRFPEDCLVVAEGSLVAVVCVCFCGTHTYTSPKRCHFPIVH